MNLFFFFQPGLGILCSNAFGGWMETMCSGAKPHVLGRGENVAPLERSGSNRERERDVLLLTWSTSTEILE